MTTASQAQRPNTGAADIESRIADLLSRMTLDEKIGQLNQVEAWGPHAAAHLAEDLRAGRIGAVLNQVDPAINAELQRIAREESRLGVPLLIGRDVIHGYQSVSPLPLGQGASWNPDLVRENAKMAAAEASASGINWTFAPMIDICRDARWGRIAESFGEDPYLTSVLGAAMVEGFQGDNLEDVESIAACAKHFAGYGASEGGVDYNTTNIPVNEMRNVHLPPFRAAVEAGVATFMTSFSDIDGIPATASEFLLRDVLRSEWKFDGLVVSDWDAIRQLCDHGMAENDKEAALLAATAGVDMDMVGGAFAGWLPALIEDGRFEEKTIDEMVANVLRVKFKLGLFDGRPDAAPVPARMPALAAARELAAQSCVLLKNENRALPLDAQHLNRLAVIGPLADAPVEQLGTWVFDGDASLSVTPLKALEAMLDGQVELRFEKGVQNSRHRGHDGFEAAYQAVADSDAAVLVLGEEAILSGEAHCRADIDLPGAQVELVRRLRQAGKPVIAVIFAGRPLTLSNVIDEFDALLYAWHPGAMGGPAIADLLFGREVPSGKLPVTFPKLVGQTPIYYARKNTGRPPSPEKIIHIDDIEEGAPQTSLGMTSFHLDAGYEPLFPFGFGLSYTRFDYTDMSVSTHEMAMGETLVAELNITNAGDYEAAEVVQLYIRDRAASLTRPIRELKGFQRITLKPGETRRVRFEIGEKELSFYRRDQSFGAEPGEFDLWLAGCSATGLHARFRVTG
jgi:beta-glucosidase